MRNKLFALILALTVVSWAQTATQTTPATPSQSTATEKAKGACCDKMAADSKDGHAACMRSSKMSGGKEMASCCGGKDTASCCGKDAKSCMKDEKSAASCCKDGCGKDKTASCCDRKAGKECGKGCCDSNKSEKPA
jgi:hypothetical protein